MDEDEDVVGNINYVQDAFIFCPIMGSIQMDKFWSKAFCSVKKKWAKWSRQEFLSTINSPQSLWRKRLHQKFNSNSKGFLKKCWDQRKGILFLYSCYRYFQFWKRCTNKKLVTQQHRKPGWVYYQFTYRLCTSYWYQQH